MAETVFAGAEHEYSEHSGPIATFSETVAGTLSAAVDALVRAIGTYLAALKSCVSV